MDENQQEKLGAWAIVELFGHTRIAGFVSEYQVGGAAFVRVDVPATDGEDGQAGTAAFTKLYGPSAIYSISFVDEATARRAVDVIRPKPIAIYIPAAPALPERGRFWQHDGQFGDDDDEGDNGYRERG